MISQRNISAVHGFASGPAARYEGAAGVAPGAAQCTAAVLFRTRTPVSAGVTQTLWQNLDQAGNLGWGIFVEGIATRGHLVLTTTIGDGVGQNPINTDLGAGPLAKMSLVHLVADDDERRVYYNGALIAVEPLANPLLPSALAPVVGDLVGVGAAASFTEIIGVAYIDTGLGDEAAAGHFRSCFRIGGMARLDETLASVDWTNRWDAREGAVVLGGQGTLNAAGDLVLPPTAAPVWTPSAGLDPLTRVGTLFTTVLTSPPWGYTTAEEGSDFIANTFAQNFINADLVANQLTVVHNLNSAAVAVVIRDNTNAQIIPDAVTMTNANTVVVDLTSFSPIPGTWRIFVIGQ
jgi:hypothetical protein